MDDTKKHMILIVDDEASNIDILYDILKHEYTVLAVKSGEAAIQQAMKRVPSLILLDVLLPDISGFEIITTLKEMELTRRIPVIFITGLNSFEDEEKGLLLGAVDYITKPFNNLIVKARIKTQLQLVEYINTIDRLCNIDALTNIANRRHFETQGNIEWKHAARENSHISLLIIDVDFFKKYNDTYGHPQGDVLLKSIATVFSKSLLRANDFVARWGGEEFVVLLPNDDINGAMEVAERIRVNTEKLAVPLPNGTDTYVTVSIGINSAIPTQQTTFKDFISGADNALYKAKETGRNRSVTAFDI